MQFPFTAAQFYGVFAAYNESVWPAQWLFLGLALVAYSLAVYPAWLAYSGHRYPALPTFGLPCPTTVFTIGMLAFLIAPYPRSPILAPLLWCLVGAQAALLLGVPQDLGLVAAAAVGAVLLFRSKAWARNGFSTL